jgi:hypothetical protein
VLVAHREDPALRDFSGQVFQDFGQRLLGDALGRRVIDVDLAIAHLERVQRPWVLQRHVDLEGKGLEPRRKEVPYAALHRLGVEETLPLARLELVEEDGMLVAKVIY